MTFERRRGGLVTGGGNSGSGVTTDQMNTAIASALYGAQKLELGTPLAAGATFTGMPYAYSSATPYFSMGGYADAPFRLVMQTSPNGTTWTDGPASYSVSNGLRHVASFVSPVTTAYVRAKVVCGSTSMTVIRALSQMMRYSANLGLDAKTYPKSILVSANYAMTFGDGPVLATGGASGITVTLPAPVDGASAFVKKVDNGAGAITINTPSGQVEFGSSRSLTTQGQSDNYVSDGTNWYVA